MEILRDEAPALGMVAGPAAARIPFDDQDLARRFHAALRAENVEVATRGSEVELPIAAWYNAEDLETVALAVVKVAHYLGLRETGSAT